MHYLQEINLIYGSTLIPALKQIRTAIVNWEAIIFVFIIRALSFARKVNFLRITSFPTKLKYDIRRVYIMPKLGGMYLLSSSSNVDPGQVRAAQYQAFVRKANLGPIPDPWNHTHGGRAQQSVA